MNARLFLQIAVSLDGYIEDAQGNIDWMSFDASYDPIATATLQSIDGMIFGRKSHELLSRFWPTASQTSNAPADLIEQARLMNALPKYVLTRGPLRSDWVNSHAVSVQEVKRLKDAARRPLALFAGAGAAQALADEIDEIRLVCMPIIVGDGTRLFAQGMARRSLTLLESRPLASGAVYSRYAVAS